MPLAPLPHEIIASFAEHTRRPTQAQLNALMSRRIALWSIAGSPSSGEHGLGFARITRLADGCFDFTQDGTPGIVVVALNAFGEPADLVAWPLRHEWIAAWWGVVSMLGERSAFGSRIDGEALTIQPDAFSWLRAERLGAVLINHARAARELQDHGPFVAAGGIEHGEQLEALLAPPKPVILVPPLIEELRAA